MRDMTGAQKQWGIINPIQGKEGTILRTLEALLVAVANPTGQGSSLW